MLTIVGIGFLIIVFNLYYVMEIAFGEIPDEFQEESFKFLIFLIFQVAMNILGILCIIQSSCAISNEVKSNFFSTNSSVGRLIISFKFCRTKNVPFTFISY